MKTTTEKPINKRERIEEIYSDVRYFKSLGLTRPAKECFDSFSDMLEKEWRGRLPEPYVYPDVLGGISVEWYLHNTEVTMEVNLEIPGFWCSTHNPADYLAPYQPINTYAWTGNMCGSLMAMWKSIHRTGLPSRRCLKCRKAAMNKQHIDRGYDVSVETEW